jgi:hypothetical protein
MLLRLTANTYLSRMSEGHGALVQVRERRPHREQTSDTVQLRLLTQSDLLTNCVHKLGKGVAAIASVAGRLRDAREACTKDVADKVRLPLSHAASLLARVPCTWHCAPSMYAMNLLCADRDQHRMAHMLLLCRRRRFALTSKHFPRRRTTSLVSAATCSARRSSYRAPGAATLLSALRPWTRSLRTRRACGAR